MRLVCALIALIAPISMTKLASASPKEAPVGCWTILTSADPRYDAGLVLCLQRDAFVVLAPKGAEIFDAWEVTWATTPSGWRATVPPAHTEGADVHFDVTPAANGELAVRSGAGWLDVRLGRRAPVRATKAVARLRACRACLLRSPQASELGGPLYSLRACEVAVLDERCAAK